MADGQQYVDRNLAARSYRPKGYGISPGLRRARKPFLFSNVLTGFVIAAFVTGVWAYSISAVRQDTFEDVDAEAKALSAEVRKGIESVEDRAGRVEDKLKTIASERIARVNSGKRDTSSIVGGTMDMPTSAKGLLPRLGERTWYNPREGLVWGAPPVDNMGKIGDRRPKWH